MSSHRRKPRIDLKQHISAVRAFHTGLVAEAQRRLYLLSRIGPHIDVLRRPNVAAHHKLNAAEESCKHLHALGQMRQPWHATYRDLARHLRQLRNHLRRLVART
jgi:hypothetical protein